jgi:hypothetical protein
MKISKILLEAAERADCGEFGACFYVNSPPETDPYDKDEFTRREALYLFEELLRPEGDPMYYWGYPLKNSEELHGTEEEHNARILGLLFAYQVAEDNEKVAK